MYKAEITIEIKLPIKVTLEVAEAPPSIKGNTATGGNLVQKIQGLKDRGFKDPLKMITSLPPILGLTFENIDRKIQGLKDRGFKDPLKMITSLPSILGFTFENIDRKIQGLKDRGFKDPLKMITSSPPVLGFTFENIDRKIQGLKDRGFKDPLKMITSSPSILGLTFENIDRKIQGLKDRGFKNPPELIVRMPTILGLKIETINQKLSLLGRLFPVEFDVLELVEYAPVICAYSVKKIVVTRRILQRHCSDVPGVSMINNVLCCPIQKLVLVSLKDPSLSLNKLMLNARERTESILQVREVVKDTFFGKNRLARLFLRVT